MNLLVNGGICGWRLFKRLFKRWTNPSKAAEKQLEAAGACCPVCLDGLKFF
ncbi:MAG: hypothetical protein V4739_11440 [Pseudomonadota bacterium]